MGRLKAENLHTKRGTKGRDKHPINHGFNGPLQIPFRRTATIFKQPFTLVNSTRAGTVPAPETDKLKKLAATVKDRPQPVFWTKALEGLSAQMPIHKADKTNPDILERPDEYIPVRAVLPEGIEPYCPVLKTESISLSLASALSKTNPGNVIGQAAPNSTKRGHDNPFYNADHDQPLVVGIHKILPADIGKQEQRVLDMRTRLRELRASFKP